MAQLICNNCERPFLFHTNRAPKFCLFCGAKFIEAHVKPINYKCKCGNEIVGNQTSAALIENVRFCEQCGDRVG